MDLSNYKEKVREIKSYAAQNNVTEEEINKIFVDSFHLLESAKASKKYFAVKILKICFLITTIFFLNFLIIHNHPGIQGLLLRNVQNYIYPGLRIFRKAAVPFVSLYPSISEFYDEWCLLENPYFQVNGMDCWPCSVVDSVKDFTGFNITSNFNTGIPFIRYENSKQVNLEKLYENYMKYKKIFDKHAAKVISNSHFYKKISDVMLKRLDINPSATLDIHIIWRINRMEPGRNLRKLFPKPIGIPDWWSSTTEKLVFIDEPKSSSYMLPNPECANVIVECFSGQRIFQLNPSRECVNNCKKVTVLLSRNQTLWYNWWYWRPESLPTQNATDISIFYASSFC